MITVENERESLLPFVKGFILDIEENTAKCGDFIVELSWHGAAESDIGYQIFREDDMDEPVVSYSGRGVFTCDHKALLDNGIGYKNGVCLTTANLKKLDEIGINALIRDIEIGLYIGRFLPEEEEEKK